MVAIGHAPRRTAPGFQNSLRLHDVAHSRQIRSRKVTSPDCAGFRKADLYTRVRAEYASRKVGFAARKGDVAPDSPPARRSWRRDSVPPERRTSRHRAAGLSSPHASALEELCSARALAYFQTVEHHGFRGATRRPLRSRAAPAPLPSERHMAHPRLACRAPSLRCRSAGRMVRW